MAQVQDWLELNDLKELKTWFLKESINGEALLDLSADEMVILGIKKIGHKKKLSKLVQVLKAQYSENTLSKKSSVPSLTNEFGDEESSDELVNNPVKIAGTNATYEVFEDFADGVVVISAKEKQILFVNKTVERMFLYPRNEILGANIKMLMAEPHRSKHDEYVNSYLNTSKASIIEQGRMVEGLPPLKILTV